MVVVAIIGLLSWVVVLQLPEITEEESPSDIAETLSEQFLLAREQALLRQWIMAVEFKPKSYRFLVWSGDRWQTVSQAPLTPVSLPEHIEFEFIPGEFRLLENEEENDGFSFSRADEDERDDEENARRRPEPQVIIFESSEFIPFRLRIIALNFEQADANLDGRSGVELIRDDEAVW